MAWYRRLLSLPEHYEGIPGCEGYCSPPAPPLFLNATFPVTLPPIPVNEAITFHKDNKLRIIIICVSLVLATCFLLVTYYTVALRCRDLRRRRRRNSLTADLHTEIHGDRDEDDGMVDEDIHHIWYIRTVGLDQNTIDSITICPYKEGDGLIESTDCSVCLSEFHDGELVRLLPKCGHAFHTSCIDTWLRSHVNCPLCRAPIVASPPPPATSVTPAPPVLAGDLGSFSSPTAEVTENSNSSANSAASSEENHQIPEDGCSENSRIGITPTAHPDGSSSSISSVLESETSAKSDGGASGVQRVIGTNESVTTDLEIQSGFQPTRRSISMDFYATGGIFAGAEIGGGSCQDRKESNYGIRLPAIIMEKQWSGPKGGSPLGIERSISSNGGKFFFSRFGRGRSNSILPL